MLACVCMYVNLGRLLFEIVGLVKLHEPLLIEDGSYAIE